MQNNIKKFSLIKKRYIALFLSVFLFNCNLENKQQNSLENSAISSVNKNPDIKKISNSFYEINLGKENKNAKDINLKVNLGNNFGTKATNLSQRKLAKDVRSLAIYLTTSNTSNAVDLPQYVSKVIVDIEQNSDSIYNFNFKNLTPVGNTTYYAAVEAFDNVNGTGNNITKVLIADPTKRFSVSSNSVLLDVTTSPPNITFSFSSGTSLNVNVELSANDSKNTIYPIHRESYNTLKNLDLSTDSEGNGFIFWQNTIANQRTIQYASIKEFLPSTLPNSPTIPINVAITQPLVTNNLDFLSLAYAPSKGKGVLVFTSSGGTKDISSRTIGNITAGVPDTSETSVVSLLGTQTSDAPHVFMNADGNGLIAFHSNKSSPILSDAGTTANTSIFAVKMSNYLPQAGQANFIPLFSNTTRVKENPRLALNDSGNGFVTWQEVFVANYDVFMVPINKYDQEVFNGTGNITINSGVNLVGSGGNKFKQELQVGGRIIASGNEYFVTAITNDTTASVSSGPNIGAGVTFKIKGGRTIITPTISTLNTGASTVVFSSPPNLKPGMRFYVFDNSNNLIESLITLSVAGNTATLLRNTTGTFTCPCTAAYKGEMMLNIDSPNTTDSKYPNIKMDNSGRGVVVWKDSNPNGGSGHSIRMRNFNITTTPSFNSGNIDLSATEFFPQNFDSTSGVLGVQSDNRVPALTLNNKGEGLSAWFTLNGGAAESIFFRAFQNFGATQLGGSETKLTTATTKKQYFPLLSLNNDGNGMLGYIDTDTNGFIDDKISIRNFKNFVEY
ncbi:MAG: hypothetical protein AABZ74_06620 [Cyanobacteriota bacterium]